MMAETLATSSHVGRKEYDVFISFRGSDVRNEFLSHLTKRLLQEYIDVYVDKRLESGNEISSALVEAIEGSRIAVVIFSKDYASSKWCLEELVKIMECKHANGQIVIPVFHNIDPSHVRHQKESYADSFAKHEQKPEVGLKKLQQWKSVLKEAADLLGHRYPSSNFSNECDLIDGIVKDVLKKLKVRDTIEPKNRLVGFEANLAFIESFMKVDSEEVGVLGIWGTGGIGKTTLARALFDKFSHQFYCSYFVSNVREESKKIGLPYLLEKIISKLLNDKNFTIEEIANAQRRLRRTPVLLVLDDVDTYSQLQYLLEENLSFGPRSKVIITSRDKHVLICGGVHEHNVHEVKELNTKESWQLFCRHAFKQAHPKTGYEELSARVIQHARGLPLALKVLGSLLYSKDANTWESALKKLRKYPNAEIQSVLKVSYDGLDIPEKKTFLDIAFFFKGEKKEDVMRVLDACDDFYVDCGINSLLNKALITISKDNRVEIHDLLQEMAEAIVREESREHPERRSRLNDAKEIQDVLENNKGTDAIEGITVLVKFASFFGQEECRLSLSADAFQKMSKLRFLKITTPEDHLTSVFHRNTVHFPDRDLDSLPSELRYLNWSHYPLKSLPRGLSMRKLVEIHMRHSKVKKLWDGVQDLMNLKIIDLQSSKELEELPDLSMAQNLEIVDLSYCRNLRGIHPSILSLPELVSLNLQSCSKIKNLHGDNHLISLKHLTLTGCRGVKEFLLSSEEMRSLRLDNTGIKTLNLPIGRFDKLEELLLGKPLKNFQINELSCLASLKKFCLFGIKEGIDKSKLAILFDGWRCLEELHLTACKVSEIPDNISGLSSLKILSLRQCKVKRLPSSIKHLSELKQLDLGECKWLRSLPELPPSTIRFYAHECTSLGIIDFTVMRSILYNNYSGEVKGCYPGSTIPKGFKCSQTGERYITIELAPPSSSDDPLLGFASCCILSPFHGRARFLDSWPLEGVAVCRQFRFDDEEINCMDENEFPDIYQLDTDNVFVCYDPMERILKGSQRRRYDEGTTYKKFECEFFIVEPLRDLTDDLDGKIKGCGIWPIYESELQQMKLMLEKGSGASNTSGPNENRNAEMAQHQPQPALDSDSRRTKRSRNE